MQNDDPKILSHQGVKIKEVGTLVTWTMKATHFHKVCLNFMYLDTISDKMYNRKNCTNKLMVILF